MKRPVKIKKYLILGGLVLMVCLVSDYFWQKRIQKPFLEEKKEISSEEKEKIEKWLLQNNLNEFGDPKGTMYPGGTPLFDEKTGIYKDRFEYLLEKFPQKPWENLNINQ